MNFVSFPFILFVALTVLIYFSIPKRFQWCVLLASSYVFLWLNSGWLVLTMFSTIVATYLIANEIFETYTSGRQYLKEHANSLSSGERKAFKEKTKRKAKCILILGVVIDLGILLSLKYFNFFVNNSSHLLNLVGIEIPTLKLLLPIGISFYTLQAIAYMVDVYRNKIEPDRNLGKFMLFMSYFPQIVQGPIARHSQLAHQLYDSHQFDYRRSMFGIQLIIWGWMKKLVIADRLAVPVNQIFDNYRQHTGLIVFLGAILYGVQIYADFSGGMDIARGVSQIFGIELELNFRQPYFSTSIEDFWRRWHITLGSWMRDYVFYPLSLSKAFAALSRKSRKILGQSVGKKLPSFLSMFIVYFLVGFWHGPEWKYVAYGIWNGVFIVAGIMLAEVYDKGREICGIQADSFSWKWFQMLRTFILISLGRFFSRGDDFKAAIHMFVQMTKKWYDLSFIVDGSLINLGLDTANWVLLLIALFVLFAVDCLHERGVQIRESIARQNIVFRWIVYYAAILVILIFGIYGPAYDSAIFIYEQF